MYFESTAANIQAIIIVYIFPGGSGSRTKQKILKREKGDTAKRFSAK